MATQLNIVAIVQARMGSTRLPGKVLKKIGTHTAIELLLKRLNQSKLLTKIVLATSTNIENKPLIKHVKSLGYCVFLGDENNVLNRYYQCAVKQHADIIVRITGDCPLIDSTIVDEAISTFLESKVDYVSNIHPPTYPDGLDTEVFSFKALQQAQQQAHTAHQTEHVTPYIIETTGFKLKNLAYKKDYSMHRWTLDNPEDHKIISHIYKHFHPQIHFGWKQILKLVASEANLLTSNQTIKRNEGATLSTGPKLYQRAKKIIPGGTSLLSKRPEMFLPEKWPAYFKKAKGCSVWDLDDREYIDMSINGIGTNTLGYGNPTVDEAVLNAVHSGNMSTLNCAEEVYLAEKLIELHPWADQVRFARSGGEINAIAVRIARAASGKDKIAICGYHGWHDWYLSANLNDNDSLSGHLLPGLNPQGVPKNLTNTVFPFRYNHIEELESIIKLHDIGVIKMEVQRSEPPDEGFLKGIRKIADQNNIVLIFDECTSGFRQTYGGLHLQFNVEPDIALFAKTLGNGYAISACIGKQSVMQAAQSTFISSTFWTERIGPTAALATLKVMQEEKSWQKITQTGSVITKKWLELAQKYELEINTFGLPALTGFTFKSQHHLAYKTFITQEMLKQGFLAANSVYTTLAHTTEIIEAYFEQLDPIFNEIKACEQGKLQISSLLKSPICHSGFARLN